ncbi:metallophosphoesterase [Chloroflexota bacterium]
MQILLVHLSDLHIVNYDEDLNLRVERLLDIVKKEAPFVESVFVVVSGDIVNKGRKEEYQEASKFFDKLKLNISASLGKDLQYIFVPGNHDCCFDNEEEIGDRERLIKETVDDRSTIPSSVIKIVCKVQKNYQEFVSRYTAASILKHDLLMISQAIVNSFRINFYCFNTSWMSMRNEELSGQPGKMYFPIRLFPNKTFISESDLSIGVFHHPHLWRNPKNSRDFQKTIERISDLTFLGHTHIGEQNVVDDLEGNSTVYINGAAFRESEKASESQFKIVRFDTKKKKANISTYTWAVDKYISTHDVETKKLKHKRIINDFAINDVTENWLDSLETNIHHSEKDDLKLSDVYVFPEIIDVSGKQTRENSLVLPLNSEAVLVPKKGNNRILILGDRKSGKSALLKVLFKRYYDDNFVPVYIDGSKIKSSAIDNFIKRVNSSFKDQYSINSLKQFQMTPKAKKFIIIDDFDKCKMTPNNIKALFASITRHYSNVVLSANNLFEITEFIIDDREDISINRYKSYQIIQFGNLKRLLLIEKWLRLEDNYITEEEFLRRMDETKSTLNTILGKGFVYKYPFYILTLLQAIQQGDPEQLVYSSYGHYYDYLFRQAIGRLVKTNDNIDALFQFLPELAYFLFSKKTKKLSPEGFEEFKTWYCAEYKIAPTMSIIYDSRSLIDVLVEASMIRVDQDSYRFAAKYVYYFFLARFFALNIDQSEIRNQISSMCKRLYRDEFANIILFLVHHTKNEFVLGEVLANSEDIFREYKPVDLISDAKAINALMDEVPTLVLQERNFRKQRLQLEEKKDEIESEQMEMGIITDIDEEDIIDLQEEIWELDLPAKISLSLRMIEILGLILKNHHSSLKGNSKYVLGSEAFTLGLRSISPLFSILETNLQLFVKHITSIVIQKGNLNDKRIESDSKKVVFGMCFLFTYLIIKFIADSVGNQYLSETFKDIVENNRQLSFEMVDIAIKLNYSKGKSLIEDLRTLDKKLTKHERITDKSGHFTESITIRSMLPYHVLLQLVQDYSNMYPLTATEEDQLSSLFKLSQRTQNIYNLAYLDRKKIG